MTNRPKAIGTAATRPTLAERFTRRLVRADSGCLIWTGYVHPKRGYGQIGRGGRVAGLVETHRLAWELTHGPIPPSAFVCHTCDNPPCCEPSHLFLGTCADNVRDMVRKGRQARGMRLPQAKLTDEDIARVRSLRADGWLQRQIAAELGITQGYVSTVLAGIHRRSVT